jgi:hypothetical protein
MSKFGTYALGAIAGFAVAFGASAPASAQTDWEASEDDFLLLKLTLGKHEFLNEVRGYQTDRGVCLDLGDVIQSLDLPVRLDKKSRRATGWLFAEDQTFTLDREANTVQNRNIGNAPLQGDIFDTPEGWCVRVEALSRWFGIKLTADTFNAAVRIDSETKLPFIEALERRSRAARLRNRSASFDLAQYPRADAEYRMWRAPSVDVTARAQVTSRNGSTRQDMRYEAFAAGELGKVSYTARLASDDRLAPATLRLTAYRNDPTGQLLGPLKATRAAVGDVDLLAGQLTGQSVVGRGAYVGNLPIGQSARFSTTTMRGAMPIGWDAELYRNGQLIAFQGEANDGRYEFVDIELYFGRNDFEVVLYGPQGQVRRIREDMPVGQQMIEPGRTHYWAGILQQDRDLIGLRSRFGTDGDSGFWRWGMGVERGLDARTSVALGYQNFVNRGVRRQFAEANVQRTFGPMHVLVAGAHEFGGGFAAEANALGRIGPVNLAAFATWVSGAFTSEYTDGNLDYRAGFRADTSLKIGKFSLPIQAGYSRIAQTDGTRTNEWFLGTSLRVLDTLLRAELRGGGGLDDDGTRLSPGTRLKLLASRRMFGLSVRGGFDYLLDGPDRGLQSARLATGKALDEKSELTFEAEYDGVVRETELSVGYSREFKHFALRGDAGYRTDGSITAGLSLAFSLGPDPVGGGVRVTDAKLARNGQALVTVFRDDDGDGRRSPGEEPLENVMIEAGLRFDDAVTAANGKAIVDELRPFQPVLVGIDESSLDDPFLVPATRGVVVVPRPGVFTEVLLPVSPSGEVEGTLLSPSGTEQQGVTLELIDKRGAVAATAISEFDGFFLFDRVAYGSYRLRIAGDSARMLGVQPVLRDGVTIDRGADVARLGAIRLTHAPMTLAARSEVGPGPDPPN